MTAEPMGEALVLISLLALWSAGIRIASPVSPEGIERALAASVLVAAAMAASGLLLGVAGLGSQPLALTATAIGLWLAARAWLPAPLTPSGAELRAGWGRLGTASRALLGAALALALAWAAFGMLEPSLDIDSAFLHLPEVATWVENGRPGSIEPISTNEVLMSWMGAVGGNVAFVLIWPILMASLLAAASLQTLRTLGCRWSDAALGTAAVLLVPIVTEAFTSLDSDLPSTAWVAACVALCASVATRRAAPELLGVALVALGLAVGTKTSVIAFGLLALAAAFAAAERRPRWPLLLSGAALGGVVGGVWYVRNLLDHGSLLWPFVDLPGGDPLPPALSEAKTSFIEHPVASVQGIVSEYIGALGGAPLILAGALILLAATRRKPHLLAALAIVLGMFLWSLAPATGKPPGPEAGFFTVTGVRYLISTILLATYALGALAARGGRLGLAARLLLVAAASWGAIDLLGGGDSLPPAWLILGAAAGGALLSLLRPPARARRRGDWRCRAPGRPGRARALSGSLPRPLLGRRRDRQPARRHQGDLRPNGLLARRAAGVSRR